MDDKPEAKAWWNDYKTYSYFLLFVAVVGVSCGQYAGAAGWMLAAMLAMKLSRYRRMP